MLSQVQYDALTLEQKKWVSRPPVPEEQIKTLVDIAITLHSRQLDQSRDWRWWVAIATSFIGVIVGAFLGAALGGKK
jgi:hypothetical protein